MYSHSLVPNSTTITQETVSRMTTMSVWCSSTAVMALCCSDDHQVITLFLSNPCIFPNAWFVNWKCCCEMCGIAGAGSWWLVLLPSPLTLLWAVLHVRETGVCLPMSCGILAIMKAKMASWRPDFSWLSSLLLHSVSVSTCLFFPLCWLVFPLNCQHIRSLRSGVGNCNGLHAHCKPTPVHSYPSSSSWISYIHHSTSFQHYLSNLSMNLSHHIYARPWPLPWFISTPWPLFTLAHSYSTFTRVLPLADVSPILSPTFFNGL